MTATTFFLCIGAAVSAYLLITGFYDLHPIERWRERRLAKFMQGDWREDWR